MAISNRMIADFIAALHAEGVELVVTANGEPQDHWTARRMAVVGRALSRLESDLEATVADQRAELDRLTKAHDILLWANNDYDLRHTAQRAEIDRLTARLEDIQSAFATYYEQRWSGDAMHALRQAVLLELPLTPAPNAPQEDE